MERTETAAKDVTTRESGANPARTAAGTEKEVGAREVTQGSGFQSGFCGGSMFGNVWVTFGEESHRRCPGQSTASAKCASMPCVCTCHAGDEPWAQREQTIFEISNGLRVTAKDAVVVADAKPIRKRRTSAAAR